MFTKKIIIILSLASASHYAMGLNIELQGRLSYVQKSRHDVLQFRKVNIQLLCAFVGSVALSCAAIYGGIKIGKASYNELVKNAEQLKHPLLVANVRFTSGYAGIVGGLGVGVATGAFCWLTRCFGLGNFCDWLFGVTALHKEWKRTKRDIFMRGARERQDLERNCDRIQHEYKNLQNQYRNVQEERCLFQGQRYQLVGDLDRVRAERDRFQRDYQQVQHTIGDLQQQADQLQRERLSLEEQINRLRTASERQTNQLQQEALINHNAMNELTRKHAQLQAQYEREQQMSVSLYCQMLEHMLADDACIRENLEQFRQALSHLLHPNQVVDHYDLLQQAINNISNETLRVIIHDAKAGAGKLLAHALLANDNALAVRLRQTGASLDDVLEVDRHVVADYLARALLNDNQQLVVQLHNAGVKLHNASENNRRQVYQQKPNVFQLVDEACSICFEAFEEDKQSIHYPHALPCGHFLCMHCINNPRLHSCPECRGPLH